jgi:uncharacterized protein (DUF58 family)
MPAIRTTILLVALGCVLFVAEPSLQWMGLFVLMLLAVARWYSRTLCTAIHVTRLHTRIHAFHCTDTMVELRVANTSHLPLAYCSIVDAVGGLYSGYHNRQLLYLPKRSSVRFEYAVRAQNRGEFRLGPVRIRGADPFGFFPWVRELDLPGSVIVYPQLHRLAFAPLTGIPSGTRLVQDPAYEDLSRYRSLREYRSGDELRRINWKATARTAVLHTNEYLSTLNYPIIILLNMHEEGPRQRHRWNRSERAIELAASLVQAAVLSNQAVGFLSNGLLPDNTPCPVVAGQRGACHAVVILECLARIHYSQDTRLFELLRHLPVNAGTRCLYIGCLPGSDQLAVLHSAALRNLRVDFYLFDDHDQHHAKMVRLKAVSRFSVHAVSEYGDFHV